MNKGELRIGSFYNFTSGEWIDQGEIILDAHHFWKAHEYCFEILETIKPILLTDEWLSRLGIIADEFGQFILIEGDRWPINIQWDQVQDNYAVLANDEYQIGEIKYVHQLQNLYFSLEHKELELI